MNNRKTKVLFVSEAPWYTTGYSVYTTEVLKRLVQQPNIEVAQLGIYAGANDPNLKQYPWKIYPNKPEKNHPNYAAYNNPTAQFGDFSYNEVLLDFMPDVVMDIRDWWMIEFEQRSPFRDFYNWAIMPTVDAEPQNSQWIATYESADGVFAYSEFGRDVLRKQSDNMKFIDMAPPAASEVFYCSENKAEHKKSRGLHPESIIVGTVMRNQKRKLYPDLFKAFRKFLDQTDKNNVFLYCHTYYPDIGWSIPELLDEHSLSNRVLFTYKCKGCGAISTDFFQDSLQYCKKCGTFKNQLVGINNTMSEKDLADIYNMFDIYVQYANSEGFGMPQLEAAYSGLPVISTYYSAMESVIDNIGGIGIKPLGYTKEAETGCFRAIPDNDAFVETLLHLTKMPKSAIAKMGETVRANAMKHYTWDQTANKWLDYINSVELKDPKLTWLSPPKIKQPAQSIPEEITSIIDKVNFIFSNVLCKPEWIGTYFWRRVLRDCTYGYRTDNVDGNFYFNESHIQSYSQYKPFSIDEAVKECLSYRNQINQWEQARYKRVTANAK
jgi:glycosyltransferase involved in cell wall biosynthesis